MAKFSTGNPFYDQYGKENSDKIEKIAQILARGQGVELIPKLSSGLTAEMLGNAYQRAKYLVLRHSDQYPSMNVESLEAWLKSQPVFVQGILKIQTIDAEYAMVAKKFREFDEQYGY
ncbi:hypothetical protein FACS189421_07000 [Bacteroidia bacterium]|nr:hypothetical protein FACS189421_07000 [Bacteroidia bacterium]